MMKKKAVYVSPFIPAEWVEAHGHKPSRLMLSSSSTMDAGSPVMGMCPYARAFAGAAVSQEDAACIIATATCDQMRRVFGIIEGRSSVPAFLMHVPHTWQTPAAYKLYINELKRLGRFLIPIEGKQPVDLKELMLKYDSARADLEDARAYMTARAYSMAVSTFAQDGNMNLPNKKQMVSTSGVPVALIGGPMMSDHFDIFDAVEEAGGYIALDATETGERTMPAHLDLRKLDDDPLTTLADSYFGHIPDVYRRPNSGLYRWLKHEMNSRGVRGIIFRRYQWCDMWNAEAERMKEWSGLPFFHLDVDVDESDTLRTFSRLKSFIEVLK